MAGLASVLVVLVAGQCRMLVEEHRRTAQLLGDTDDDEYGMEEMWRWKTGGQQVASPAAYKDGVVVFSITNETKQQSSELSYVSYKDGVQWTRRFSQSRKHGTFEEMTPVVGTGPAEDLVFVVEDSPATLLAVNAQKQGKTAWSLELPKGSQLDPSAPIVSGSGVVVVSATADLGYSAVIGVRATDGKLMWENSTLSLFGTDVSSPVFGRSGDVVYVTGKKYINPSHGLSHPKKGWLTALDTGTGASLLHTHLEGSPVTSAPAFSESTGLIYVSQCRIVELFTISCWIAAFTETGEKQWDSTAGIVHTDEPGPGMISSPVVGNVQLQGDDGEEMVFVSINASGGMILAMDAKTGKQRWNITVGSSESPEAVSHSRPVIVGSMLLITRANNLKEWIYAFEATTGRRIAVHTVADGAAAGGCYEKYCMPCGACIDPEGNYVCPPSAPLAYGGILYVGTLDGTFIALVADNDDEGDHTAPNFVAYLCVGAGVGLVLVVLMFHVCLRTWRTQILRGRWEVSVPTSLNGSGNEAVPCGAVQKYRVVQKLGSGNFGVVYLVRRVADGERYAMKYIPCDSAEEREEALREWQTVSQLPPHPNLIRVLETFMNWHELNTPFAVGFAGGCQDDSGSVGSNGQENAIPSRYVCIVMPFMDEGDLNRYILSYRRGCIPERVVLSYTGQIASLLSALHSRSPPLIHRDLKPENVLLADHAKRVVVTDFGLARSVNDIYCRTHAGSLAFMAPEIWAGAYSTEVDVWALGCISYVLCTLRVERHNCRVLWREAADPAFRQGIMEEIAKRGYSAETRALIVAALTPDRRARPDADFFVSVLYDYIPVESARAAQIRNGSSSRAADRKRLLDIGLDVGGDLTPTTSGLDSPSDRTALSQERPLLGDQQSATSRTPPRRVPSLQAFPGPGASGDFMS
eukprot:Hpha_TRINITY_DN13883_c0_g1::TRINITY_DN13883_c0_g1_i1::g.69802::m.69802